jgi:FkbM family methyltransferase
MESPFLRLIMADHVYDTEYATMEFGISGETQMMERLSEYQLNTIFDVGANIGEWARMVKLTQPTADVHCFEPVPQVFKRLVENTIDLAVMPNPFGLSSECEIRDMLFDDDNDRLTTPCLDLVRVNPKVVPLIMLDGDNYCRSREIGRIDFLKIDTEGHEYKVLQGFKNMLEGGNIAIIQFEYGYANVLTKDLLIDFYKMLKPLGYEIGIQTPEGIHFREYNLGHETFRAPNYVAVHNTAVDFIASVQVQR